MDEASYFATPPTAECAFLGPYASNRLSGQFGIRIETETLSFVDPDCERELEPEIYLEYLTLPSIEPARLENTRFTPDSHFEGSFYFCGEHNWVDLLEIRFLAASNNAILAEFDLVIHLPTAPPSKYRFTLRAVTQIKIGDPKLEEPRFFEGLGILSQDEENSWKGSVTYDGYNVTIELRANAGTVDEIATYARSVVSETVLSPARLEAAIAEGLRSLDDKFREHQVQVEFKANEFIPREFFFSKRRHHESPELTIVLKHPRDAGHWSLGFYGQKSGLLVWVPKA